MPQDDNDTVLHQDEHEALIEEVVGDEVDGAFVETKLAATSTQVHIPDAVVAAGANPTKAEYDALVAKFNLVLGVLRDASLIPSS